jgi:predicted amidohydrolase YtcJ
MMSPLLLILLACGQAPPGPLATPSPQAPHDLVLVDATRAVVVDDGKIVAIVGVQDAPQAVRILRGDRLTAGFVDAHAHPEGLGKKRTRLDLMGVDSYRETLERVSAWHTEGWITGRGWDQNDWPDAPSGGWPLAADLDAIHPERPVALRRVDGHAVWLNSAALSAAGIGSNTPDPAGGSIVRDGSGQPTGVLIDTAMDLVKRPQPTPAERDAWVRAGLLAAADVGLTGLHVMGSGDATLAVFQAMADADELPIRLWVFVSPGTEAAQRLLAEGPRRDAWLSVVGIKAYADGALGSRGALLHAPYSDAPDHRGNEILTTAELVELATESSRAGTQLAVHAIGDRGVSQVLDAFEAAKLAHPQATIRHRVEHVQVVRPADLDRFVTLGVVASMQPTHATSDMPWAEARLGPHRVQNAYAWRSVLDREITLAFGSDFPVELEDPALGLWAATTRTDATGAPKGGWFPNQVLSADEAVAAFTSGAAAAVHEQARLGSLAVGRTADLTLWTVRPDGSGERWRSVATVVNGAVVAQRALPGE